MKSLEEKRRWEMKNKEEELKNVISMLRELTIEDMRNEKLKEQMSKLLLLLQDYKLVFKRLEI